MVALERSTDQQNVQFARRSDIPRILVVDDEAPIVELLCMVLEEEGFSVTGATSGYRAAELIRTNAPDLVLTDVMMPGMNGYDLAQLARETRPETRVVLMSAAVQPPSDRPFPFIAKPFDLSTMIGLIEGELRAS